MCDIVTIHWVGIRKTGDRGAIMGWATETAITPTPASKCPPYNYALARYVTEEEKTCYVFWGKIGKKLYIEDRILTSEFLFGFKNNERNYKQITTERLMSIWGKSFTDEWDMFRTMIRLRS